MGKVYRISRLPVAQPFFCFEKPFNFKAPVKTIKDNVTDKDMFVKKTSSFVKRIWKSNVAKFGP